MGNLVVILILFAVGVGLYFLSRLSVKHVNGANWGGFILSLGIISTVIGLLMMISSVASAVDAGRVTELSIGLKGDLAQTSDMVKQVNDKLIASLPIAEAVTLMNNTKTNFEKKNALFLSKLKEANLNIEQWNVVAGSMLTSMDSLDTVKNDFATVYTAYESGVKGTADEKAELKTAADGLSKLIVSFWDQLRIAGFKKTDEK